MTLCRVELSRFGHPRRPRQSGQGRDGCPEHQFAPRRRPGLAQGHHRLINAKVDRGKLAAKWRAARRSGGTRRPGRSGRSNLNLRLDSGPADRPGSAGGPEVLQVVRHGACAAVSCSHDAGTGQRGITTGLRATVGAFSQLHVKKMWRRNCVAAEFRIHGPPGGEPLEGQVIHSVTITPAARAP